MAPGDQAYCGKRLKTRVPIGSRAAAYPVFAPQFRAQAAAELSIARNELAKVAESVPALEDRVARTAVRSVLYYLLKPINKAREKALTERWCGVRNDGPLSINELARYHVVWL